MSKELETSVVRVRGAVATEEHDWLAVERPLRILARVGDVVRPVSTTMRTPGDDFLFGERVLAREEELTGLLGVEIVDDDTVLVDLAPEAAAALEAARRPFVTTGACGVCGRADVDALTAGLGRKEEDTTIATGVVHALPSAL
jgi:FdhD protein